MNTRRHNLLAAVLALAATTAGLASAQTVAAMSNSGDAALTMRDVQNSFIPSDAKTSQEVLRDKTLTGVGNQAAGQAVGMVGSRLITAPAGIGGIPLQMGLQALMGSRKRTVKGFTVFYLRGLSAETQLPAGTISLNVDTDPATLQSAGLLASPPLLFRLQTSNKDMARILRTNHISYKDPGGSVMTADLMETDQSLVSCLATRQGDKVTLVPDQPLEPGEYAVVLPTTQVGPGITPHETLVMAWDFRISQ